jgi:hypothetical protein
MDKTSRGYGNITTSHMPTGQNPMQKKKNKKKGYINQEKYITA